MLPESRLRSTQQSPTRRYKIAFFPRETQMPFPQPFYRWRPHPWHGLETGRNPPLSLHAYIEITPFDTVKYEIDKKTGYLRVDRPQRTSSQPPTLYGFRSANLLRRSGRCLDAQREVRRRRPTRYLRIQRTSDLAQRSPSERARDRWPADGRPRRSRRQDRGRAGKRQPVG